MEKLSSFLAAARKRRNLTLRAVETETGISNAYLSQLENGKIQTPSPVVLHKLSELYRVPYATTLELTGYPVPQTNQTNSRNHRLAARLGPTTDEEEEELVEYLEFLRSRKRRGGRQ